MKFPELPLADLKPFSFRLSNAEYRAIRDLVYSQTGIRLSENKRALIISRLQKLLRARGFHSFAQYYDHVMKDKSGEALSELVNRISTHHTFFYREKAHFDFFFQTVLPELSRILDRTRDIRIWCSGCATGEEPYTLIMLMMEYFGDAYGQWNAGLLATDIAAEVLEFARAGVYSQERIHRLPPRLKNKYFVSAGPERWAVRERVKKEVTFRRFNLINRRFPFKKPFHVIFCRNVMIYFDQATRQDLVARFYQATAPGGYLFIGHSESLDRSRSPYIYVLPAVYRKVGHGPSHSRIGGG